MCFLLNSGVCVCLCESLGQTGAADGHAGACKLLHKDIFGLPLFLRPSEKDGFILCAVVRQRANKVMIGWFRGAGLLSYTHFRVRVSSVSSHPAPLITHAPSVRLQPGRTFQHTHELLTAT